MKSLDTIRKELGKMILKSDDVIRYAFPMTVEHYVIQQFGKIPYINSLASIYEKEEESTTESRPYLFNSEFDMQSSEYREKTNSIDYNKTVENILKEYSDAVLWKDASTAKLENSAVFHDDFIYFDGLFYMDSSEIPKRILKCVVMKDYKPQIRWVLRDSHGHLDTKYMEITPKGTIEDNYNDDFLPVNSKINEVIRNDESAIIILHGKPGTGKTSYIRDLIDSNRDVKFYWLDASMFNYIDSVEFIQFISSCANSVFILEDSESLLTSRDHARSTGIQSLLSLSDGMLGDSLKLKFICTFNTDMANIDKAILRKGRLKVKYEFKDLQKEKVEALFEKLGMDKSQAKAMPLCDIYNFLEDNGTATRKASIGFGSY